MAKQTINPSNRLITLDLIYIVIIETIMTKSPSCQGLLFYKTISLSSLQINEFVQLCLLNANLGLLTKAINYWL